MEAISNTKLPKINTNPKMRIHNIENVNVSVRFIASKVKLQGVSAEGLLISSPSIIQQKTKPKKTNKKKKQKQKNNNLQHLKVKYF